MDDTNASTNPATAAHLQSVRLGPLSLTAADADAIKRSPAWDDCGVVDLVKLGEGAMQLGLVLHDLAGRGGRPYLAVVHIAAGWAADARASLKEEHPLLDFAIAVVRAVVDEATAEDPDEMQRAAEGAIPLAWSRFEPDDSVPAHAIALGLLYLAAGGDRAGYLDAEAYLLRGLTAAASAGRTDAVVQRLRADLEPLFPLFWHSESYRRQAAPRHAAALAGEGASDAA